MAVHLFLRRADQVLLSRRYQTGYEDGHYSVPAGHVDGGETVREAMMREAEEECGILPQDLTMVGVMHRRSAEERVDFFMEAQRWRGDLVNREPHKCDELRWVAMADLPANTIPYIRFALEQYQRGAWYSEFGWDARDKV